MARSRWDARGADRNLFTVIVVCKSVDIVEHYLEVAVGSLRQNDLILMLQLLLFQWAIVR